MKTDEWFTVEPIDERTFALSEYGQWMKLHSFLFIGEAKAALIDTGLGIANIRTVVESLTDLPVTVITTHSHWDHTGGHNLFTEILIHELERNRLEEGFPGNNERIRDWLTNRPFTRNTPPGFDLRFFEPTRCKPTGIIRDEDVFELGGRSLKIIQTPGHSQGHVCVFEPDTGYLATGDLLYSGVLLAGITGADPNEFKKSIDRIKKLSDVKKLLPGHGNLAISTDLIHEAAEAFETLERRSLLKRGTGLHKFKRLRIQV